MDKAEQLFAGYEAGRARASQMVSGARFLGSRPEAINAGYEPGSLAYECFALGYAEELPRNIVTDDDGIIL